jgi:hypothetical protein
LNLFGLYLSDDRTQLLKWPFPQGISVQPGAFISVWADNDTSSGSLHANFKLSGSGEELFLSNSLGEVLDSLIFGLQNEDVSLARCPDGFGDFAPNMLPTKGLPNNCGSSNSLTESKKSISVWKSVHGTLYVSSRTPISAFRILDATGREIFRWLGEAQNDIQFQLPELSSSLLILQIPGQGSFRFIR